MQKEHDAALAEARATTQRLEVERADALERLRVATAVFDTLRLRVRPARQHICDELIRGYRVGRLSYLDLIAEQRGLLETDLALVDAEADVWRSRVRLDLLVGRLPGRAAEGR
jgi:outer membrane protein TolC